MGDGEYPPFDEEMTDPGCWCCPPLGCGGGGGGDMESTDI